MSNNMEKKVTPSTVKVDIVKNRKRKYENLKINCEFSYYVNSKHNDDSPKYRCESPNAKQDNLNEVIINVNNDTSLVFSFQLKKIKTCAPPVHEYNEKLAFTQEQYGDETISINEL